MKKGDRFIFYGKSSTVKGIVNGSFTKIGYDVSNGVRVVQEFIVSEDGDSYNRRQCLKIDSEIGPSFLKKLISVFKKKDKLP